MSDDRLTISPDYNGEVIVMDPEGDPWVALPPVTEEQPPPGQREQRYSSSQPRDPSGKWTSGAGGIAGGAFFGGGGTSPLPPDEVAGALIAGSPANISHDDLDDLMLNWESNPDRPDANLVNLSVDGKLLTGDKGLPNKRTVMPQFDGPDRPAYLADLEARGVKVQRGVAVNPLTLKPGQDEVSARSTSRLFKVYQEGGYDRANHVLITSDGRVLDGNHRWSMHAAARADGYPDATLMVDIIDLPASVAIPDAQKWTVARGIATKALGQDEVYAVGRMQENAGDTRAADSLLAAVNDWGDTKPWNWSLDDVVAGHVAPLVAGGEVPAVVDGQRIIVDPAFWDMNEPDARRNALYAALEAAGYTLTRP